MLIADFMQGAPVRRISLRTMWVMVFLLLLGACRAPWDEAKAKKAAADTRQIMHSLQAPDMVQYRKLTLPPEQREELQQRWPEVRKKLALDAKGQSGFDKLLIRFTEPKAEAHLQRDLNAKIKPLKSEIDSKWPLMQASLTLLLQGWIETNQHLSAAEKAHGKALVLAVIAQMPPEWLQDKALRERAFQQMVSTARSVEIQNYQQIDSLDYVQFHQKLTIFMAGLKKLGLVYGLDWNAGQKNLQVKVLEQSGKRAKVQLRYPLGQKWVEFTMDLIEHDGQWYDASAVKLFEDKLGRR
jgi:hypothetical protein